MKKYVLVDTETGEVLDEVTFETETNKEYRFAKRDCLVRTIEPYSLIDMNGLFSDIAARDDGRIGMRALASLIYLATYATQDGYVTYSNFKKRKTESVIDEIGEGAYRELINTKHIFEERDSLRFPSSLVLQNQTPANISGIQYVAVFKEHYRDLFRSLDPKGRTALGHVVRAIIIANYDWNVCCHEVKSRNKAYLGNMNAEELNEALFQNKQNIYQWLKKATSITYVHDAHEYRLCMYQTPTKSNFGGFFISPYLFYRGKDIGAARSVRSGKDGKNGWIVEV